MPGGAGTRQLCQHMVPPHALPLFPQSSIEAEGFRSLREGEEVEYDVEDSGNGRIKAIHVTGPGGAAPLVSGRVRMLAHDDILRDQPVEFGPWTISASSDANNFEIGML